jgi:hypothetical protein
VVVVVRHEGAWGAGCQGVVEVVVVVTCERAGGGYRCVVVVGWSLSLSWVMEQSWWVMEQGGRKWAGLLLLLLWVREEGVDMAHTVSINGFFILIQYNSEIDQDSAVLTYFS